jgi:integrase
MEGRNANRPKPGAEIKVEPIRKKKDITAIKKLLADKPRDLALFIVGINTNLRASDLVKLTVGKVRDCKPGCEIELRETKTGKPRRISLNKPAVEAIQSLLASKYMANADDDDTPLFKSQRGEALEVSSVHRLVKGWCGSKVGINLVGNYGSHTLRKTWGYHARQAGVPLPILVEMFNHSSQKQTLSYLGIQPEEIADVYLKLEL